MKTMTKRSLKSSQPVIQFKPRNAEEEKHLLRLESLLTQKRRGDWGLVGEILGVETQSAEKAFRRVYSKNHLEAVEALEKIINNRIELFNN